MSLNIFLQFLSAITAMISSAILTLGSFNITIDQILKKSEDLWTDGYDMKIIESLIEQKVYSTIGFLVLLLSFIFQIISICFQQQNIPNIKTHYAIIFLIVICLTIGGISYLSIDKFSEILLQEAKSKINIP